LSCQGFDTIESIAEVRRAVGDDIILMGDFNQGLSFNAALRRLHQLDDQGLEWFEEPIVFDDFAGSARLANELKTPLQIGENIYGPRHFLQAVTAGAADCYMPDLERIGGVTGWLRSAAIAGAANLTMSTHLYPEFSAHLMRVTETADWLEWRDWGVPFLAEPFEIRGSAIHIPVRPGAGIAWDEAAVKRFVISVRVWVRQAKLGRRWQVFVASGLWLGVVAGDRRTLQSRRPLSGSGLRAAPDRTARQLPGSTPPSTGEPHRRGALNKMA